MEMLPPLQGHDDQVKSVAFSPDGSKFISGSFHKTIRVWDASTGIQMLPPLQGHDEGVYSVAFSPDGSKIVSGSGDKTIRVWDAHCGTELPCAQTAIDQLWCESHGPAVSLKKDGWFTNTNTGRYMGQLPVGASFDCWKSQGLTYFGWTIEHKLIIIHFPSF
jgi:WD40 repeat protein